MNNKSKYPFLFVLLVMVLTACGTSSQATAPVSPTKASVEPTPVAAVAFSNGRFIKSINKDYGFIFKDGNFSVFQGNNTLVEATYKVDGNVFTETSNTGGCKTNMSFNYTFDGSTLTFTYIGDPEEDVACPGRHDDFNNVTYILQEK